MTVCLVAFFCILRESVSERKNSLEVPDFFPPLLVLTFWGLAGSTNLSFEGSIRRRKKIEDD